MAEHELPIAQARAAFADVVTRATQGTVTHVTRHGDRVAAIVPSAMARPPAEMPASPARPAPSAPGGRYDYPDQSTPEALTWMRAALEAMHSRLTAVVAAYAHWTGLTGQALAALAEGHHGTVEDLLRAIDPHVTLANDHSSHLDELYYALTDPDDAYCAACDGPLAILVAEDGWQHYRTVPNTVLGAGTTFEAYTPADNHPPKPRFAPRLRPAIVDGAVAKPPPAHTSTDPSEQDDPAQSQGSTAS